MLLYNIKEKMRLIDDLFQMTIYVTEKQYSESLLCPLLRGALSVKLASQNFRGIKLTNIWVY